MGMIGEKLAALLRGPAPQGAPVDNTPPGRDYTLYVREQQAQGLPVVSQAEHAQGKR